MAIAQNPSNELAVILAQSSLLGGLEADDLALIASRAERITLDANNILFQHGDEGEAMYVLVSGALEVSVISVDGKKFSLNMLMPGEVLGEISVLDGKPRTATVVAREKCELYRISSRSISNLLSNNTRFARNMVLVLCARLRWINQQVEDHFLLTTESRLANRLLMLHKKFADEDGLLRISQSELSEFLGTSRETVNKTLQGWRSRNLIELGRGSLRITKPDILQDIVSQSLLH